MPQKKICIIISNGRNIEQKLSHFISEGGIYWTYFGQNYLNFKRMETYLDNHFKYIDISKKLDTISNKIRVDFQRYIDDLNTANKDTFEWWFTPISSRNPSMSGVFQNLCYLELIKEIIREISSTERVVIVAENYSIGHAIEANADALGVEVIALDKYNRSLPISITSGIWWISKCLFKAGLNYVYAGLSAIRTENKPAKRYAGILGKTCIIDVVVYEKNFSDDGGFADRYFPGLEPFLIENGYNVVYYPIFTETKLNKYSLYSKARANDRIFLIEQDFLQIKDYFRATKSALKSIRYKVKSTIFDGFDVGKIDEGDFKWDCFENIFKAYLQYYAFLRMSAKLGDKFERIISWHENQLQDKAMCKAVHETFKACKIMGSHAYVPIKNILNTWISIPEYKYGFSPDIILSMSHYEYSNSYYCGKIPIRRSPSFRNAYLFDDSISHKMNKNQKYILILLPISLSDAYELLDKVFTVFDNYSVKYELLIKCHPDYDRSAIMNYITKINVYRTRFSFTSALLNELIHEARLVISTSSSSIVEFAACGVPSIFVAKTNSLCYDPLYEQSFPHYSVCYDITSLTECIIKYSEQESAQTSYSTYGNMIKNLIYYPVTEKSLEEYLK